MIGVSSLSIPETAFKYYIPESGKVTLRIYNLLGKEIRTLVNNFQAAGRYEVQWDGTDTLGRAVASGIYLYQLQSGAYVQVKKMTFLKW